MRNSPDAANSEQIRRLAHQLWEEEGRPEGCAEAHWLKAEAMLTSNSIKPARKKAPAKSKVKKT